MAALYRLWLAGAVRLDVKIPLLLLTAKCDANEIAPMAAQGLAAVYVTITTLDAGLARKLEPRAAAPHRRLRTLRTLAEHGVPCGVSLAPQIPFLTEDIEQVLEAAWDAGARTAHAAGCGRVSAQS